ncbi:winged helix-turn-helix transcriptional regulator [Rhodococcus sp. NPDC057014]|uniref:winged helix-turn-helix transcriptional regulator n=1 Tax=Rhodococcus sp. NPDC057014 TaxID=3346000 RepID=UPI0036356AE0
MGMKLEADLADRSRWRAESCSVDKTMAVVGSRSAMLFIREAMYGTTRFADFVDRVGVTEAAAATRLKQLVNDGVLEKRPYREAGARTRYEYELTQKGRDLLPVILAMINWGDRYLQGGNAPLQIRECSTGEVVVIAPKNSDGVDLSPEDLEVGVAPTWRSAGRRRSNSGQLKTAGS